MPRSSPAGQGGAGVFADSASSAAGSTAALVNGVPIESALPAASATRRKVNRLILLFLK